MGLSLCKRDNPRRCALYQFAPGHLSQRRCLSVPTRTGTRHEGTETRAAGLTRYLNDRQSEAVEPDESVAVLYRQVDEVKREDDDGKGEGNIARDEVEDLGKVPGRALPDVLILGTEVAEPFLVNIVILRICKLCTGRRSSNAR